MNSKEFDARLAELAKKVEGEAEPTTRRVRHNRTSIHRLRHGRWVSRIKLYECSECGFAGYPEMNYCPRCGAKMDYLDEVEEDE